MATGFWDFVAKQLVASGRFATLTTSPKPSSADSAGEGGTTPEGIFCEVSARQLDTQISTNDVLDTRNMNIVWIGSTVLPLAFGLLAIRDLTVPHRAEISLKLSLISYALLLAAFWWASRARGLSFRPDLEDLLDYSDEYTAPVLQQWVAIEQTRSAVENQQLLNRKARWVGLANTMLYLEGFFLSLAAWRTLK